MRVLLLHLDLPVAARAVYFSEGGSGAACEPPRASVMKRGAGMLCVGGWLKPHAPVSSGTLNVRLPRGWSERQRASVRSARGVLRVCVEGNSHSEAEVSINTRPGSERANLLSRRVLTPTSAPARFCLQRGNQRKSPEGAVTRSNKSKSSDREGHTHEHASSPTPLRAFRRISGKPVVGIAPTRRRSQPGAQRHRLYSGSAPGGAYNDD